MVLQPRSDRQASSSSGVQRKDQTVPSIQVTLGDEGYRALCQRPQIALLKAIFQLGESI
jgi:hypothetical protein